MFGVGQRTLAKYLENHAYVKFSILFTDVRDLPKMEKFINLIEDYNSK